LFVVHLVAKWRKDYKNVRDSGDSEFVPDPISLKYVAETMIRRKFRNMHFDPEQGRRAIGVSIADFKPDIAREDHQRKIIPKEETKVEEDDEPVEEEPEIVAEIVVPVLFYLMPPTLFERIK